MIILEHSVRNTRTRRANIHIFRPIIGTAEDIGCYHGISDGDINDDDELRLRRGARTPPSQPHSVVTLIQPGTLIARLLYVVVRAIRNSHYCCIDFTCTHVGRACLALPPPDRACESLMALSAY